MENDICLPVFQLVSNKIAALSSGNISGKGNNPRDGFYRHEINTCGMNLAYALWSDFTEKSLTNNDAIRGHILAGYLQPTTRSCTKIDSASRSLENRVFFVELDEFERGTSTITLFPEKIKLNTSNPYTRNDTHLLCKFVIFVKTTLPRLFLGFAHRCLESSSCLMIT